MKYTLEQVQEKFKERNYILLETEYINASTKMKYQCPYHPDKELYISLSKLTQGRGCPFCAKNARYSIEELNEKFQLKGYTLLSTTYINANSPLNFECDKHPQEIQTTTWNNFRISECNCKYCNNEKTAERNKERCSFSYNLVKEELENTGIQLISETYKNSQSKLKCFCPIHEIEFDLRFDSFHFKGSTCPKCGIERRAKARRLDTNIILEEFNKRGYEVVDDLEQTYINASNTKIHYICKQHPDVIQEITYGNFKAGKGCKYCHHKISSAEQKIAKWLLDNIEGFQNINGIDFQKKFEDLKDIQPLSYDFYLADYNLLIEYQGGFHDGKLIGTLQTEEDFEKQKKHDEMKYNYAISHGYNILYIWYYENIKKKLTEYFLNDKTYCN